MNKKADPERRLVHYRGQVQGVGFRYTAQQVAVGFAVTGYVQNLADGRVRLVAEGAADELDRFLDELRGRMAGYIRDVQSETGPGNGEFEDFDIRH